MTVSTETVRMAKSRPRKNQSERSDLPCHIIRCDIQIENKLKKKKNRILVSNSLSIEDSNHLEGLSLKIVLNRLLKS